MNVWLKMASLKNGGVFIIFEICVCGLTFIQNGKYPGSVPSSDDA